MQIRETGINREQLTNVENIYTSQTRLLFRTRRTVIRLLLRTEIAKHNNMFVKINKLKEHVNMREKNCELINGIIRKMSTLFQKIIKEKRMYFHPLWYQRFIPACYRIASKDVEELKDIMPNINIPWNNMIPHVSNISILYQQYCDF